MASCGTCSASANLTSINPKDETAKLLLDHITQYTGDCGELIRQIRNILFGTLPCNPEGKSCSECMTDDLRLIREQALNNADQLRGILSRLV